ncbi:hypothetical protein DP939_02305 [Spongiactinospora rosea]|uniref:Uncharacterized protein n=1 Tax=Spongiactinospora rosea TaxID=2248750 RepID=A0A366M6W2_9ACTN|nr:hypothetical protein [Spongiactinospora rosea]RBQ21563.1 hypothetical protein DP939_02305 [Spongiactinospora rosea]
MTSPDDYLRTALPVLLTYTRQVLLDLDLGRMRAAAEEASDQTAVDFLSAAIVFAQAASLARDRVYPEGA